MLRVNPASSVEVRRPAIVLVTPWMPRLGSGGPTGACYRLLDALSRTPDLGAGLYCLCMSPLSLFCVGRLEGMDVFAMAEGGESRFRHIRQRAIEAMADGPIRAVRDVFYAGFTVKEHLRRDTLRKILSHFLPSCSSSLFHAHFDVDVDRLVRAIEGERWERPRIILTEHSKGGMRRQYVEQLGPASVRDRACAALERWQENAVRAVDMLAFPSKGAQELWEKYNPALVRFSSPKSVILHNGVPRPKAVAQAHERAEEVRLLAIAEHVYDKGIDRLILGMARLRDVSPGRRFRLRIAGGVTAITPKLVQMKSDLRLGTEVELLGKISHEALMQEMADASFLVAMPRVVVFDLSILEAMALGKPVLTTELSGNIEALGTGYPLFVKDEMELARKIADCDANSQAAREIGHSNFLRYEALFTSEAMASQHCRLYARLFEPRAEKLAAVLAQ